MAFRHDSSVADPEHSWGKVDHARLPRLAYAHMGSEAQKSTWQYPHHWVESGGNPSDESGIYTTGTLRLHRAGVNAAWAAARGVRSGQQAPASVLAHLEEHRRALGMVAESQVLEDDETEAVFAEAIAAAAGATKVVVDRDAGVVRNVPIMGSVSPTRNRRYTHEALVAAVPLFEGLPFYGDRGNHEDFSAAPSPFDLIGMIESPRWDADHAQIRGDIRPVPTMSEWFFSVAESDQFSRAMGCSPRMRGVRRYTDGEEIVSRIVEVDRVDLVSAPGTVGGLHESADNNQSMEEDDMKWAEITRESLAQNRPDIIAVIESELRSGLESDDRVKTLAESVKKLEATVASKEKELDDLRTERALAEKKERADALLAESELPPEAISDTFRDLVRMAESEDAAKVLIEDRQTLVAHQRRPRSRERHPNGVQDENQRLDYTDDDTLVSAVKG